jgi:D-3-phosphoglycerate dehydrogenase
MCIVARLDDRAVFVKGRNMATYRCAILDDYQNVALGLADYAKIPEVEFKVFNEPVRRTNEETIRDVKDFDVVVMMRERTAFPRPVIEALPKLKLLITTGMANRSIDLAACAERNVLVCGTSSYGNPTTGITFGLMIELTRRIGWENARMKSGHLWQVTLGADIEGKTLGILGLGKLGTRAAGVAKAFGMKTIAWSQNLTPEKCKEAGVEYVSKDDLFRQADFVTIHLQLSDRTRGLVTARELGLMKKSAYIVNTSRGPIIDEKALLAALGNGQIAGAGLDVFDVEPLPLDHPFRKMDNVVITPHLGYVSQQNFERYYPDIVENIRGWLDKSPVRVITAK